MVKEKNKLTIAYLLIGIGLTYTLLPHSTHMSLGIDFGLPHTTHLTIGIISLIIGIILKMQYHKK